MNRWLLNALSDEALALSTLLMGSVPLGPSLSCCAIAVVSVGKVQDRVQDRFPFYVGKTLADKLFSQVTQIRDVTL